MWEEVQRSRGPKSSSTPSDPIFHHNSPNDSSSRHRLNGGDSRLTYLVSWHVCRLISNRNVFLFHSSLSLTLLRRKCLASALSPHCAGVKSPTPDVSSSRQRAAVQCSRAIRFINTKSLSMLQELFKDIWFYRSLFSVKLFFLSINSLLLLLLHSVLLPWWLY